MTFLCVAAMDALLVLLAASYVPLALGRPSPAWIVALACAAAIAARGTGLRWKSPGHRRCVSLFDRGIGLFLAALFISAFAPAPNPAAARLAAPYLTFGLISLWLSRRAGLESRGRRGAAAAIILALGATVASLAAPSLSTAAEAVGRLGAKTLAAVEPALLFALRLLAGFGTGSSEAGGYAAGAGGAAAAAAAAAPAASWLGTLAAVLTWACAAAAAAFLFALVLSVVFKGLASLLERLARGRKDSRLLRALLAAARAAAGLLGKAGALLAAPGPRRSPAARAYHKLLACGRAASLARAGSETPREYASRLARELPRSARAAEEIVMGIEREAYGGLPSDEAADRRLARLRRGTRRAAFVAERALGALGRAARRDYSSIETDAPSLATGNEASLPSHSTR
jgi:hypothetical protein